MNAMSLLPILCSIFSLYIAWRVLKVMERVASNLQELVTVMKASRSES